jgi:hypothetical protein
VLTHHISNPTSPAPTPSPRYAPRSHLCSRPGTFLNQARTQLNTTDANTCELCAINKYRPTFGATSCLDCPRGTQTSNTGNVECTDCPIGYYNNQAGTPCKPAPAGTFVNTTGAFVTTPW